MPNDTASNYIRALAASTSEPELLNAANKVLPLACLLEVA